METIFINEGGSGMSRPREDAAGKGVFMRIAISTDAGQVSAHFGRCPSFTLVDIEDGKVTKRAEVANPGHQPGAIPQFLHQKGVQAIVAGGMGMRAVSFFEEYGIRTVLGVSGEVDDVIEELKKGTLRGGESLCSPGSGKGYGLDKEVCDHPNGDDGGH